ncbi:MAG: STAS domain-containing protein [Gallionellaceae bacterium]|jgi:anti-anti-sigma factor
MARKAKEKNEVVHLPIEGDMTIFVAQELREAIMPLITQNDEVEIDLSHVSEVDAAGMQLMVSVKLEAILRGKTLRYVGHSKPVLDMIDLCDLGGFFGDQVIMSSAV